MATISLQLSRFPRKSLLGYLRAGGLTILPRYLLLTLLLTPLPIQAHGQTTATADSTAWWGKNQNKNGKSTWIVSTPTGAETIGWSSGPTTLDDYYTYVQKQYGPEFKFTVPLVRPSFRFFTGFTNTDGPGKTGGTTASQSGSGSSTVSVNRFGTNFERADWTVSASGVLGIPPRLGLSPGASYQTTAVAKDPWPITPSQLAEMGVTGSSYSLFFPVGLSAGRYSANGDITLDASYETASGNRPLFHLDLNARHDIVTGDSQANFYLLDSLDDTDPNLDLTSSSQRTLSQLETLLSDDVTNDTLNSPLYIGIDLENLPVPMMDMGDGSVARIHIDSSVIDAASVPEPSTLSLYSLGILTALGYAWRYRKRSQCVKRLSHC
jgi:hypothetical protein